MDKYKRHEEICHELNNMYEAKNQAYGDAFGKTFREFGEVSALTRMSDKWERIKHIVLTGTNDVPDETISDTLRDLANYCIMAIIELEIQKRKSNYGEKKQEESQIQSPEMP